MRLFQTTQQYYSRSLPALLLLGMLSCLAAYSQDVLTYHNNNARTGGNNQETTLTLSNVNSASFGKLFTIQADGYVDAQPLYLSAVVRLRCYPQSPDRGERARYGLRL